MRTRLESITLKGFKTIRELDDFRPGQLTVLIGPNGAGKSNFLSFFRMLSTMSYGTTLLAIPCGFSGRCQQTPARRPGRHAGDRCPGSGFIPDPATSITRFDSLLPPTTL